MEAVAGENKAESGYNLIVVPKNPKGKPAKRSQILAMQRVLLGHVVNPKTEPHKAAQCACAWERLEARAMAVAGLGVPKPVPAKNEPKLRARKGAQPVE